MSHSPETSTPTEPHGYTWKDACEIKADDLKEGETFVNPGRGTAYTVDQDGRVRGARIAWEMPMDGTAWTVLGRRGRMVTAVSHLGHVVQDALPQTAHVLRVVELQPLPDSVLEREPWRGGQRCGLQTAYGMPNTAFCGRRKALGLRLCQQHHDDLGAEIRFWAPGNAEGLALVHTIHGWSVYDRHGRLCASSDDRVALERAYGFTLAWEGEQGEPVEATRLERAS